MFEPLVLPLNKVANVRDLGAYYGFNGRAIKRHKLLRSGKLFRLPQDDMTFFENYGLKKIIDFRTSLECEKEPDSVPAGVEYIHLAVHEEKKLGVPDQDKEKLKKTYSFDQYAGFKVMCHQYRKTVRSTYSQAVYRKFFEILANNEDGAVLYHCSEGKDRTGIATYYLLHILGVDGYVIRDDYLFSNYELDSYRKKVDTLALTNGSNQYVRANLRSLASVANEYLDSALILINNEYGGLDNYLKESIGIDQAMIERLRELYLEPKI
ncbi:tyrosine-protein phosphatase [Lactobacillus sp. PV034]|uniref:tyrosine-protein phosphatase n=1 Tax=Lactobacillus sp. PV034 TaxID=2594495 RepID=UPI00224071BE|nr:tyrosine-protein phosphatase [Lactobacillus sp. PV034]QNQ81251.1 tyrosine-protein phosphatase [Lactobacillus sp. PV034]